MIDNLDLALTIKYPNKRRRQHKENSRNDLFKLIFN